MRLPAAREARGSGEGDAPSHPSRGEIRTTPGGRARFSARDGADAISSSWPAERRLGAEHRRFRTLRTPGRRPWPRGIYESGNRRRRLRTVPDSRLNCRSRKHLRVRTVPERPGPRPDGSGSRRARASGFRGSRRPCDRFGRADELPLSADGLPHLAGRSPLFADEPPLFAERVPLLADEPPLLADELPLLADGLPRLADELPLSADGLPLLADELPLLADGFPLLPDELPLLAGGSPLFADGLPQARACGEEPPCKGGETPTVMPP